MATDLAGVVARFVGQRVVVIGDAVLDRYVDGAPQRLAREAPVPVVRVRSKVDCPGGAANAAVNFAALGARTTLVAVVGDDDAGRSLLALLEERGVDTSGVVVARDRATMCLQRVAAGGHLLARVDEGTDDLLDPGTSAAVAAALHESLDDGAAIVVSDYGLGLFSDLVHDAVRTEREIDGRLLVVDSKHPAAFRHLSPTVVKPNWAEALALLGTGELDGLTERAHGIARHGDAILDVTGAAIAAVTLDTEGAIVFERGRPPHRTYARPRPHANAAGAGDTFVAALTLALLAGAHTPAAAEVASRAAAVVVADGGTTSCTAAALELELRSDDKVIGDPAELARIVQAHRRAGRSIVFTNGCFDLLHRGHITYLDRAKTLGDVLVVGVNDDASVVALKGPGRPIIPLVDRVGLLGALSCVDHVVPFAGLTPDELLRTVRPDVFVKGGDYRLETLPEARLVHELGCRLEFLPLMQDLSTTSIIDRIRATASATVIDLRDADTAVP